MVAGPGERIMTAKEQLAKPTATTTTSSVQPSLGATAEERGQDIATSAECVAQDDNISLAECDEDESDGDDDTFVVYVETLTGQREGICVKPTDTVLSLKQNVEALFSVPSMLQDLVFCGEALGNDTAELSTYGLADGCSVRMVVKVRAGPVEQRRITQFTEQDIIFAVKTAIDNLRTLEPDAFLSGSKRGRHVMVVSLRSSSGGEMAQVHVQVKRGVVPNKNTTEDAGECAEPCSSTSSCSKTQRPQREGQEVLNISWSVEPVCARIKASMRHDGPHRLYAGQLPLSLFSSNVFSEGMGRQRDVTKPKGLGAKTKSSKNSGRGSGPMSVERRTQEAATRRLLRQRRKKMMRSKLKQLSEEQVRTERGLKSSMKDVLARLSTETEARAAPVAVAQPLVAESDAHAATESTASAMPVVRPGHKRTIECLEETADVEPVAKVKRVLKNRCGGCNRKLGLVNFTCRCSGLFCGRCRSADAHNCKFDYKK